jgi:hypothetical protein
MSTGAGSTSAVRRPAYFVADKDENDRSEFVWTYDRWQAIWLEAAEAELLMLLCPGYVVTVQPLNVAGLPDAP